MLGLAIWQGNQLRNKLHLGATKLPCAPKKGMTETGSISCNVQVKSSPSTEPD
jgi:hypothetical protein